MAARQELAHHAGQVHPAIAAARDAQQMQHDPSEPVLRHRCHGNLQQNHLPVEKSSVVTITVRVVRERSLFSQDRGALERGCG